VNLGIDNFRQFHYNQEEIVRFIFKSKDLLLLYTEEKNAHRYSAGVVDAFFEVMSVITSATSEADFRALKSLHYEKLKGARAGQISLRLNKQYRLIIQNELDEQGKIIWVIEIVDYH
jgi:proteic killer suppression protein